jgi:hypothetical protein
MNNYSEHKSLIIWQKWFDPFGEDDSQDHSMHDPYEDTDTDDYRDNDNMSLKKPVRAIATPMGLIPYTENTASSKIFNFWVGHTNFDIDQKIADIIELSEGVETLDIFTRYRFRIAIGKVFDDSSVMKEINDSIYNYLESNIYGNKS